MPAEDDALPAHGPARAWDAGADGRVLLDRHLRAGARAPAPRRCRDARALGLIGVERTVAALEAGGLRVDVLERRRGPLGPLLTARAPLLEARGLLAPGKREEEIVVVRGAAT